MSFEIFLENFAHELKIETVCVCARARVQIYGTSMPELIDMLCAMAK